MKVLVTGSGGQVGQAMGLVAREFPDLTLIHLDRMALDITNLQQIDLQLQRHAPDALINTAACTDVDGSETDQATANAINAAAPGLLAQVCSAQQVRLLHLSTDYVFDGSAAVPYRPEHPTNPCNVYGSSKALGERAVRVEDPMAAIVRSGWIYSPFRDNFVKTIIRLANRTEVLTVVDDQIGTPCSALDVARACLALTARLSSDRSQHRNGRIWHLASKPATSWFGFATEILNQASKRKLIASMPELLPIPTSGFTTAAVRPAYSVLAAEDTYRILGSPMPDWRRSLSEVLDVLLTRSSRP